ncbi:MAG: hypothetical protein KF800_18405 [Lysobacter sp.]|nr:hypothetical protein [Lysobacter sp.]
MNPDQLLTFVDAIGLLMVPVLVLTCLALPRPRRFWLRGVMTVFVSWLSTVLFTAYVYNPAGNAAGHAAGKHFPEGQYDNNTVGIAIFFGWLCPTVLVLILAGIRFAMLRIHRKRA